MLIFQVYEAVTGRIPLAKFKSIEIKKACTAEGAEYHEAADCFLVTGSLAQVINVKKHINKNGMSSSERSGSSSSEHEKSASPSFQEQYDTQPSLATYIQAFHNEDLKKIQQCYNVVITWASDGSKVQIEASSASGTKRQCKLACDEFVKFYQSLYQYISKISFDVKMQIEGVAKESLELIVCSVTQYVPGLIWEKGVDGRTYNLWGTQNSLQNGQEWIRRQLGISSSSPKTRSLSPRTGQDKLKGPLMPLKGVPVKAKVKNVPSKTNPTTTSTTGQTSASPRQPRSPSSGQRDNPAITTSAPHGNTQHGKKSWNDQRVKGGPGAFTDPTASSLSTKKMAVRNGDNGKDSQMTQGT